MQTTAMLNTTNPTLDLRLCGAAMIALIGAASALHEFPVIPR